MTTPALWQQYVANRDQAAREQLILEYVPLVRYVIARLALTLPPSMDTEDLYGYGIIGLIDAVERFSPERGVKFETYAVTRIRGAIIDELRSQDWVPRSVRSRAKTIAETLHSLEARLGRPASDDELAKALNVSSKELGQMLSEATSPFLSLDELVQPGEDGQHVAWVDIMSDDRPGPANVLEEREFREQLVASIESLPEREKTLLSLYYTEGLTLKEIGLVLGVSESRVCQLHTQAVLRLRNRINRYLQGQEVAPR